MPEILHEPQEQLDYAPGDVRFGKVFVRKKAAIPEPMQVQESNSDSLNEVTISDSTLQLETEPQEDSNDQDLPIAIRKGTRECTKRPLYPLAHFLSFKNFSPHH